MLSNFVRIKRLFPAWMLCKAYTNWCHRTEFINQASNAVALLQPNRCGRVKPMLDHLIGEFRGRFMLANSLVFMSHKVWLNCQWACIAL